MKKVISHMMMFLATVSVLAVRAYAVWPASTTLAEEAVPASGVTAKETLTDASQRAIEVVNKLDADERRLQLVLRDIEEDRKKLKEQDNGHSVR